MQRPDIDPVRTRSNESKEKITSESSDNERGVGIAISRAVSALETEPVLSTFNGKGEGEEKEMRGFPLGRSNWGWRRGNGPVRGGENGQGTRFVWGR